LALKKNGTLWSWGAGIDGALGDNTTVDKYYPEQIGSDTNWIDIKAGFEFSLGLKSDGTLWSWGFNGNGQLGNGTIDKDSVPKQIGTDHDWIKIATGSSYAFAIKSDSTLYGWGINFYGCLGAGTVSQYLSPQQIGFDDDWSDITGAKGFYSSPSIYGYHSLGLKSQKNNICISGWNANGQLGDSTTVNKNQFTCTLGSPADIIKIFNSAVKELILYPNPASDFLFVKGLSSIAMAEVYDISGKLLITNQNFENNIDIGFLANGVYFIKLITEEGSIVRKFVKE